MAENVLSHQIRLDAAIVRLREVLASPDGIATGLAEFLTGELWQGVSVSSRKQYTHLAARQGNWFIRAARIGKVRFPDAALTDRDAWTTEDAFVFFEAVKALVDEPRFDEFYGDLGVEPLLAASTARRSFALAVLSADDYDAIAARAKLPPCSLGLDADSGEERFDALRDWETTRLLALRTATASKSWKEVAQKLGLPYQVVTAWMREAPYRRRQAPEAEGSEEPEETNELPPASPESSTDHPRQGAEADGSEEPEETNQLPAASPESLTDDSPERTLNTEANQNSKVFNVPLGYGMYVEVTEEMATKALRQYIRDLPLRDL